MSLSNNLQNTLQETIAPTMDKNTACAAITQLKLKRVSWINLIAVIAIVAIADALIIPSIRNNILADTIAVIISIAIIIAIIIGATMQIMRLKQINKIKQSNRQIIGAYLA